jgi:hypothetical protein
LATTKRFYYIYKNINKNNVQLELHLKAEVKEKAKQLLYRITKNPKMESSSQQPSTTSKSNNHSEVIKETHQNNTDITDLDQIV